MSQIKVSHHIPNEKGVWIIKFNDQGKFLVLIYDKYLTFENGKITAINYGKIKQYTFPLMDILFAAACCAEVGIFEEFLNFSIKAFDKEGKDLFEEFISSYDEEQDKISWKILDYLILKNYTRENFAVLIKKVLYLGKWYLIDKLIDEVRSLQKETSHSILTIIMDHFRSSYCDNILQFNEELRKNQKRIKVLLETVDKKEFLAKYQIEYLTLNGLNDADFPL